MKNRIAVEIGVWPRRAYLTDIWPREFFMLMAYIVFAKSACYSVVKLRYVIISSKFENSLSQRDKRFNTSQRMLHRNLDARLFRAIKK